MRRAALGAGRVVVLLLVVVVVAACPRGELGTTAVSLGTTVASVNLTPEHPVAVADVNVGAAGRASTVSVSVDAALARVAAFDPDSATPRFIDEARYYSDARIGTMQAADQSFHRHVMVWADPARLPADVSITTSVWVAIEGTVPPNLENSVSVSAEWTVAGPPSDVSAVASGEFAITAGETVPATLDLHFAPAVAADPTLLVPTWVIDAGIVPDDPAGGTASLVVRPGTTGSNVTLFSPGSDRSSVYQPDTITCTAVAECDLHYDLTFGGRDAGTIRWQVTAELVDFTGDAPPGRTVDIVVSGIPSAPVPLDTQWRWLGGPG